MIQYGLGSDSVLAFEVVDIWSGNASGSIVTVDKDSHPDLFWALRGAGQNVGLVTAFHLKLQPAATVRHSEGRRARRALAWSSLERANSTTSRRAAVAGATAGAWPSRALSLVHRPSRARASAAGRAHAECDNRFRDGAAGPRPAGHPVASGRNALGSEHRQHDSFLRVGTPLPLPLPLLPCCVLPIPGFAAV